MDDPFFPYDLDSRWNLMFKALGVGPSDGVTIRPDGAVVVTYGRKRVETTVENIKRTGITGPHRWWTAVGLRLSFADDGVTFGTNHRSGLCLEFRDKIPKIVGFRDHSTLWVSVADPAGLADALDSRSTGADGDDR